MSKSVNNRIEKQGKVTSIVKNGLKVTLLATPIIFGLYFGKTFLTKAPNVQQMPSNSVSTTVNEPETEISQVGQDGVVASTGAKNSPTISIGTTTEMSKEGFDFDNFVDMQFPFGKDGKGEVGLTVKRNDRLDRDNSQPTGDGNDRDNKHSTTIGAGVKYTFGEDTTTTVGLGGQVEIPDNVAEENVDPKLSGKASVDVDNIKVGDNNKAGVSAEVGISSGEKLSDTPEVTTSVGGSLKINGNGNETTNPKSKVVTTLDTSLTTNFKSASAVVGANFDIPVKDDQTISLGAGIGQRFSANPTSNNPNATSLMGGVEYNKENKNGTTFSAGINGQADIPNNSELKPNLSANANVGIDNIKLNKSGTTTLGINSGVSISNTSSPKFTVGGKINFGNTTSNKDTSAINTKKSSYELLKKTFEKSSSNPSGDNNLNHDNPSPEQPNIPEQPSLDNPTNTPLQPSLNHDNSNAEEYERSI